MANRKQINDIKKVTLSIASNKTILEWSKGEVTKPETINYKTFKPERDGLFDEKIFGPIKDYVCPVCQKKHKRADSGKPCASCGESIIQSKMTRRRQMGHIQLVTDVSHIWFTRVDYSVIKTILDLKQDDLDSIIYFKSHIVYETGKTPLKSAKFGTIISVQKAPSIYRRIIRELKETQKDPKIRKEFQEKINELEHIAKSEIGQSYGIDFFEYNDFIAKYSDTRIGTGAEIIKVLLSALDLKKEERKLVKEISKTQDSNILFRRLKIVEAFRKSKQTPSDMILNVIPVIPADLRPLIQLDGGRHSTVDINELYRRAIIRNNRLKAWLAMQAPMLIIQNEKRMLQESIDALFDNSRRKNPVVSKDNRPLKSLAENLKGKQGRFRQNLLGKRVDYSGRSVIVVGPELKLHQVGLPKQMVVKLFEPFIVKSLVEDGVVKNIKQAKKMIELMDDKIWKYASRVIKNHPVLLNRAPTLHRLSIQAFEPVITSGKAIRLHPLVTPAFNADFDGDQMAVHVPLSKKAKDEAWKLMLSSNNVLGPKDGKLILLPGQDIILGLYFLTKVNVKSKGSLRLYASIQEIKNSLELKNVEIHSLIAVPLKIFESKFEKEIKAGKKYVVTTVGRVLINAILPKAMKYVNDISEDTFKQNNAKYIFDSLENFEKQKDELASGFKPFKKSHVAGVIEKAFDFDPNNIAEVLDAVKDLGFEYSMWSGVSLAITDIVDIKERESIIKKGEDKVDNLQSLFNEGLLTDDQRYLQVLRTWAEVRDDVKDKLQATIENHKDNSLFMMMDSGARGNISNFVQLAGLRGSMAKATHEYAALRRKGILVRSTEEIPVKSSFKVGLTPFEYFLSTHGARKGLSDTATKTAESGYLTRRLVDTVQDVLITEDDCKTNSGVKVKAILDTRTKSEIKPLSERIIGRYAVNDVKKGSTTYVKAGELITADTAKEISKAGIEEVEIRNVLTCNTHKGLCKKCYGLDLTSGREVNIGEAVGILSAQSIGEPGTQLTMRTFHTGGVAGVADITQGFARLMELVDANRNPKAIANISEIHGKIESIETYKENEDGSPHSYKVLIVNPENKDDKQEEIVDAGKVFRVKKGQIVQPGTKLIEGSIQLQKLLKCAGTRAVESYLIKEIQRLYKIQGIDISDKYMEVIIRQMLSKIQIVDPGDTETFYTSQIVSKDMFRLENERMFKEGKKPAFGRQIILGVKPLPLQSESFLAAASYQRTSEALVNAAIAKKQDNLFGIKENLIIGKPIPVGTGFATPSGKFADVHTSSYEAYNKYYDSPEEEQAVNIGSEEMDNEIRVVNELHDISDYVDPSDDDTNSGEF